MHLRYCVIDLGFVISLFVLTVTTPGQAQERVTIIPAFPQEAHQQAAVLSFLHEYFSVLAQGDVTKLALYHPGLTPEQREALSDYFAHTVRDLHISLQDVQVRITANIATVSFNRTDRFVDRLTSRPVEKSIRLLTTLVQDASGWRPVGPDLVMFALDGTDGRTS